MKNYFKILNECWEDFPLENRSPITLATLFGILQMFNRKRWPDRINIYPSEFMDFVGIRDRKALAHQLRLLHQLEYIAYQPGKNQFAPTMVRVLVGSETTNQVNTMTTAGDQALLQQSLQRIDNQNKNTSLNYIKTNNLKEEKERVFSSSHLEPFWSCYKAFYQERTKTTLSRNSTYESYLSSIVHQLTSSESDTAPIQVWSNLLTSWNLLKPYFQSKITLKQIDQDLGVLLNEHYHHANSKTTTDRKDVARKDFKF